MRTETISVTHKGKMIFFDTADDQWKCNELGFADVKLSSVKRKIDAKSKSERTINMPAIYVRSGYWNDHKATLEDVTITVLADDGRDCFVKLPDGKTEKVSIHNVYDTEQRFRLSEWEIAHNAAHAAAKVAANTLKHIKCLDSDKLQKAKAAP